MKARGYSIIESNHAWFVRWNEHHDGKRSQPSHRLCSVKDYPKRSEVEPLAQEYMAKMRKAKTIEAGSTVREFVINTYFPTIKNIKAKGTIALYNQAWNRLEPHLGCLRLRDVQCWNVQAALDNIYAERGDELGHDSYMHTKICSSAIFALALRLGHHPGPNPADYTTVRGYGHHRHRENGAYTLEDIRQFLQLFPAGPIATAIGLNAFLALRKAEAENLLSEDYDRVRGIVRIHRRTKTGNDEELPVIAPLRKLLVDGWEPVNMRRAELAIRNRIAGTSLKWKGWYGFRRGMVTNLYRLHVRVEEAALILRNSAEVVRRHYLRLEQVGTKADTMAILEQAWDDTCAASVQ